MAIELRIPDPSDYPNDPLGYATAIIDAQIEYRRACFAAIDKLSQRAGTKFERPQTTQVKYERTIHDYLCEHPEILKRYKQIGPLALLEL